MPDPKYRKIIHLDLDAFFCAVEELDHPELAGKAFAVGGRSGERGVIASCSYPARKKGVHSAMPTSQALRLCPDLILVSGRHGRYGEKSDRVMEILRRVTPLMEQVSIDEAFLDVSDLQQDPELIARELQATVAVETGLPCSLGVATNKLVAKIATDTGKARSKGNTYPRAILVVPPGREAEFLAPLPVKAMWGVGPKMEESLRKLGIHTIGDLAAIPEKSLIQKYGKYGSDLFKHAQGIDDSPVVVEHEVKSISQETTFDRDSADLNFLRQTLRGLSAQVGYRLRQAGVCGGVIRIKLRWSDFSTHTRQISIDPPTDQDGVIYNTAQELFMSIWEHGRPVRLLGVGVANLTDKVHQMTLWETPNEKERKLLTALDDLREKYGRNAIQRAENLQSQKEKANLRRK